MTKFRNKSIITIILILITLLIIGQVVYANTKEPGSTEDPIVTLSYVEQRIEQLKYYIDDKLSSEKPTEPAIPSIPSSGDGSMNLEIVNLKTGERLIGNSGTEIILRGGKAIAITSHRGGLSDVTQGRDIQQNEYIPDNHLLIVPRDDGRGVLAKTEDVILLVRGNYIIER